MAAPALYWRVTLTLEGPHPIAWGAISAYEASRVEAKAKIKATAPSIEVARDVPAASPQDAIVGALKDLRLAQEGDGGGSPLKRATAINPTLPGAPDWVVREAKVRPVG